MPEAGFEEEKYTLAKLPPLMVSTPSSSAYVLHEASARPFAYAILFNYHNDCIKSGLQLFHLVNEKTEAPKS